jgi:hypothetical protein
MYLRYLCFFIYVYVYVNIQLRKELVKPHLLTATHCISPLLKEYDVIHDIILRMTNKITHNKTVLEFMPPLEKWL